MAKLQKRISSPDRARSGTGARAPRDKGTDGVDTGPPARRASLARELAAQVEALRAELAEARERAQELELRADVDALLDILNRRGFERELKRSLAYADRYGATAALVFIDLDRFKPVNDTYGHAAGDAVLLAVAAALKARIRASDVIGRLGGDELAILLWNVTPEAAAAKAVALEQTVARTVVAWKGARLSIGASAGVAMLEPGEQVAEVIARADRAMYARKSERRATVTR